MLQLQYPNPTMPQAPGPNVHAIGAAAHHAPLHGNQSSTVLFIKISGLHSEDFAVFERQIRSSVGLYAVPNFADTISYISDYRRECYNFTNNC